MCDPITLEVVCEGLIAIVREMRATVICASYSPVIRDMDDFSCGDPLARDPERVRRDVSVGYVSPERARRGYGVVLTAAGDVDTQATIAERARLAAARRRFSVVADEREPYEGRRGRHRVLRMAPPLARELGVDTGDLVELLGRHPAPLRAWVRVDDGAPAGRIALDALGRRILGIAPGDTVEIRRLPMPPIPGGLVDR